MSLSPHAQARLRRVAAATAGGALVAAGLLVPALAAHATDPAVTISDALTGDSLVDAGWTGPAADSANGYDFNLSDGTLQASNYKNNGDRGVINQLSSPKTVAAGEPGYTTAAYDSYDAAFTVDSATGAYTAQPNVTVEVDLDNDGNRAGGTVWLRIPEDNTLEIDHLYSTDPYGELWQVDQKTIPFNGPVSIDYGVQFVAGGADQVTVTADNGTNTVTLADSGSYEGYHFGYATYQYATAASNIPNEHQTVDQVTFRASGNRIKSTWSNANTDPNAYPWEPIPDLAANNADLPGTGFNISDLVYGASQSDDAAYAFDSTSAVTNADIDQFEAGDGSNYTNWHVGSNDGVAAATGSATVISTGQADLEDFVSDSHATQLLKGIPADDQPTDLYPLVAQGLAWATTTAAPVSYQIALTADAIPGNHFATLHPESETEADGLNVVKLSDTWVSTKPIGSLQANHNYSLGTILAALEPDAATDGWNSSYPVRTGNVHVLGFGVASEADHTSGKVSAIYFGGVKYTFSAASALDLSATLAGTPAVGQTLSATTEVDPSDATLTYQWLRNGSSISHATASTYTLTSSDYGKQISVKVTGKLTGYTTQTVTTAKTAKVGKGTITPTGSVIVNGAAQVGVKLTVTLPVYDTVDLAGTQSTGVTESYQWLRDGAKISGGTHSTYTLTSSDLGHAISVTVTAKKTDYTSLVSPSAATADVAKGDLAVTQVPTIKSSQKGNVFKAGKSVSATSSGWTANGVSTTSVTKRYFWFVYDASVETSGPTIGDLVSVSTSSSFTLPSWTKGLGLSVAVYVVGTKTGFAGVQSSTSIGYAIP